MQRVANFHSRHRTRAGHLKHFYFRLIVFILLAVFVGDACNQVWQDYQKQEISQIWVFLAFAAIAVYAALGVAVGIVLRRFPEYVVTVPIICLWFLPPAVIVVAGLAYGWPYTESPVLLYIVLPVIYYMWFEDEAKQLGC